MTCQACKEHEAKEKSRALVFKKLVSFFLTARVHHVKGLSKFYSWNSHQGPSYWLREVMDELPEFKTRLEKVETRQDA